MICCIVRQRKDRRMLFAVCLQRIEHPQDMRCFFDADLISCTADRRELRRAQDILIDRSSRVKFFCPQALLGGARAGFEALQRFAARQIYRYFHFLQPAAGTVTQHKKQHLHQRLCKKPQIFLIFFLDAIVRKTKGIAHLIQKRLLPPGDHDHPCPQRIRYALRIEQLRHHPRHLHPHHREIDKDVFVRCRYGAFAPLPAVYFRKMFYRFFFDRKIFLCHVPESLPHP